MFTDGKCGSQAITKHISPESKLSCFCSLLIDRKIPEFKLITINYSDIVSISGLMWSFIRFLSRLMVLMADNLNCAVSFIRHNFVCSPQKSSSSHVIEGNYFLTPKVPNGELVTRGFLRTIIINLPFCFLDF
jgi:hypothetical protein